MFQIDFLREETETVQQREIQKILYQKIDEKMMNLMRRRSQISSMPTPIPKTPGRPMDIETWDTQTYKNLLKMF